MQSQICLSQKIPSSSRHLLCRPNCVAHGLSSIAVSMEESVNLLTARRKNARSQDIPDIKQWYGTDVRHEIQTSVYKLLNCREAKEICHAALLGFAVGSSELLQKRYRLSRHLRSQPGSFHSDKLTSSSMISGCLVSCNLVCLWRECNPWAPLFSWSFCKAAISSACDHDKKNSQLLLGLQLCNKYSTTEGCPYGARCSFIHSLQPAHDSSQHLHHCARPVTLLPSDGQEILTNSNDVHPIHGGSAFLEKYEPGLMDQGVPAIYSAALSPYAQHLLATEGTIVPQQARGVNVRPVADYFPGRNPDLLADVNTTATFLHYFHSTLPTSTVANIIKWWSACCNLAFPYTCHTCVECTQSQCKLCTQVQLSTCNHLQDLNLAFKNGLC